MFYQNVAIDVIKNRFGDVKVEVEVGILFGESDQEDELYVLRSRVKAVTTTER